MSVNPLMCIHTRVRTGSCTSVAKPHQDPYTDSVSPKAVRAGVAVVAATFILGCVAVCLIHRSYPSEEALAKGECMLHEYTCINMEPMRYIM